MAGGGAVASEGMLAPDTMAAASAAVEERSTKPWRRLGSVLHSIGRVAAAAESAPAGAVGAGDVCACVAALEEAGRALKRRRFEVASEVADEAVVVAEGAVAYFLGIVHAWRAGDAAAATSAAVHSRILDACLRLQAALAPLSVSFSPAVVSPTTSARYNFTASAGNKALAHAVAKARVDFSASLRIARADRTLAVSGPLLDTSPEGTWATHRGVFRGAPVAVKLFAATRAGSAAFRDELRAQAALSFHPNFPNLVAWADAVTTAGPAAAAAPQQQQHQARDVSASPMSTSSSSSSSSSSGSSSSSSSCGFQSCEDSESPQRAAARRKPAGALAAGATAAVEADCLPGHLPKGGFIVLEHAEGPMDDVLEARVLGRDAHKLVIGQLLRAVLHLHSCAPQAMVHGLINGVTVLIEENGAVKLAGVETCQLADPGTGPSKVLCDTHCNPCYQAPELLLASGRVEPSSDIYSVGCVMYKLLTGLDPALDPALMHPSLLAAEHAIPPFWYAVIRRCVAEDPAERPSCAALLALVENAAPVAPGTALVPAPLRSPRRGPAAGGGADVTLQSTESTTRGATQLEYNDSTYIGGRAHGQAGGLCGTDTEEETDTETDTYDAGVHMGGVGGGGGCADSESDTDLDGSLLTDSPASVRTAPPPPRRVTVPLVSDAADTPAAVRRTFAASRGLGTDMLLNRVPLRVAPATVLQGEGSHRRPFADDGVFLGEGAGGGGVVVGGGGALGPVDSTGFTVSHEEYTPNQSLLGSLSAPLTGCSDADQDWALERKGRLLAIEQLKAEIKTMENKDRERPYGFRQHVAENIAMAHFRSAADVETEEGLGLLRETAGKFKETAYGELALALWCDRRGMADEATRERYEKAASLAGDNDAEPRQYLAGYLARRYQRLTEQRGLDCSVLLLNDSSVRLALPRGKLHYADAKAAGLLPEAGTRVLLPGLTGADVAWTVEGPMHGGVKLTTDPALLRERRRVNGMFVTEEEVDPVAWDPLREQTRRRDSKAHTKREREAAAAAAAAAAAEEEFPFPAAVVWRGGVAMIGQEVHTVGAWTPVSSAGNEEAERRALDADLAAALRHYEEAARVDPTHQPTTLGHAEALGLCGRWEEAAEVLKAAARYTPASAMLHARLAEVYHYHLPSSAEKAEAAYRSALEHCGDGKEETACLKGNFATYLVQRGLKVAALKLYKEALEADPNHCNNAFNAGVFLKIVGEPIMAAAAAATVKSRRDLLGDTLVSVVAHQLLAHAGDLGHYAARSEAEALRTKIFAYNSRYAHFVFHELQQTAAAGGAGRSVDIPEDVERLVARATARSVQPAHLTLRAPDDYLYDEAKDHARRTLSTSRYVRPSRTNLVTSRQSTATPSDAPDPRLKAKRSIAGGLTGLLLDVQRRM